MKKVLRGSVLLIGVLAALAATQIPAAQPPDPTASDSLFNTAGGTGALQYLPGNQYNGFNTAFGYRALWDTGENTASGGGSENSGFGSYVLSGNTTGTDNTAIGWDALAGNSTGNWNTASGAAAMNGSNTGNYNTASGAYSLHDNTSGSSNIAVGYEAGYYLTTGSNNIDIGSLGVAGDSGAMRLGGSSQTQTFIAGISGVTLSGGGSEVIVNANGQLGVVASSARYKKDINDMGDDSSKLFALRPVTFHYTSDPVQEKQYGLVAEEVAQVYPDLVVRNGQGQVESVQYHELVPMLVNELQKQQKARRQDEAEIAQLRSAMQAQALMLSRMQARVDDERRVASR